MPIRIIDQTDTTVTFQVDNTFGSYVENMYIEYYNLADGSSTCVGDPAVGLCAEDDLSFTAHCTGDSSQTLVDLYVYDTTLFDPTTDTATIPSMCGGECAGGASTVRYTFSLWCKSQCPATTNRRLRGAPEN